MGSIKGIKFELSLIEDFNKLSIKEVDSGTNYGGDVQDWLDKKNILTANLKNSLVDQQNVINFGDKLKQSFKELGIDKHYDNNQDVINELKKLNISYIKAGEMAYEKLSRVINFLK